MNSASLARQLWDDPALRASLEKMTLRSAFHEIPAIEGGTLFYAEEDWYHLLRCASIFLASGEERFGDLGLRILHSALTFAKSPEERAFAAALLAKSGGAPALGVAAKKAFVADDVLETLPIPLAIDVRSQAVWATINIGNDEEFVGNDFQNELWRTLVRKDWVSASAPTSAGKSFLLEKWIQKTVVEQPGSTIFYIVPTRALIAQVEADLRHLLASSAVGVSISTLPLAAPSEAAHHIFVYTQERFHLYLQKDLPDLAADLIVIDEAQQIGANQRGVLLQQVLEMSAARFPDAKLLFASPSTKNPEALLAFAPEGKTTGAIEGMKPMVNQNLFWVSAVKGKPGQWRVELLIDAEPKPVGMLQLAGRPTVTQKLPFVARAVGGDASGNIVYVNRASDAEKVAEILAGFVPKDSDDPELRALSQYCEKAVHRSFTLRRHVLKGVAFHYGNMPQIIRTEVERLFSAGKIKYLVCTSTLVEGVNLACRNIFMRNPKRGSKELMPTEDFWNLAGRAGRWGKEFQGNIFCLDPEKENEWLGGSAPRLKQKFDIRIATQRIADEFESFLLYLAADGQVTPPNRFYEYLFSYLVFRRSKFGDLGTKSLLGSLKPSERSLLEDMIDGVVSEMSVPIDIVHRNPGINPIGIDDLYRYFQTKNPDSYADLVPTDPLSDALVIGEDGEQHDAAIQNLIAIFTRMSKYLGAPLGRGDKAYGNASLVVLWMRGYPLHRIIDRQISYWRKRDPNKKDPAIIRETLEHVEKIARFETPKYLHCYIDVLIFFLKGEGQAALADGIQDFWLFLEFGVSKRTQLSLMSLGLSRSSVTAISEFIIGDELDETACLDWLATNRWDEYGLTRLVELEVGLLLKRNGRTSAAERDTADGP